MKDLLYKKFTDVPTRPGRGGTYPYIRWQDVADRMNQTFGIQWSSEIVYQDVVGPNVVTRVRVTILDATTGNVFFQEGFGGAPIDDRQEAGTPFKAAYSKALKDACKKWGVGLYMEEDDAEQGPVVPLPASTNAVKTPVVPSKVPAALPKNIQTPVPPGQVTNTVAVQQVDPAVKVPNLPPTPPGVSTGNQTTAKTQAKVAASDVAGFGATQTTISDVQTAALQSIISIQGVEYDQLVQDAYEAKGLTLPDGIPAMETLSYKDAVMVVKYGNDRFRKR